MPIDESSLSDRHLVSEAPHEIWLGALPEDYADVPFGVVVNVCGAWPSVPIPAPIVLCMPMLDALEPELVPQRERVERFLASVHEVVQREPSYWHCHAGLNRSGFVLAAYLHLYRGMRISDAIALLRDRRSPMVLCNSTFERTLRKWYGSPAEQQFSIVDLSTWVRERLGRRKGTFR